MIAYTIVPEDKLIFFFVSAVYVAFSCVRPPSMYYLYVLSVYVFMHVFMRVFMHECVSVFMYVPMYLRVCIEYVLYVYVL